MATLRSNSLFFTVRDTPPLQNVGWTVRVLDPNDFSTVLAVVYEFISLTVGTELNNDGAGSITLNADTPFWTTRLANGAPALDLLDQAYLWEAWEDGVLRVQWVGETVEETILDDNETHGVVISGPGTGHVLTYGIILRPGWPNTIPAGLDPDTAWSGDDASPSYYWGFSQKWPAMRMWWNLFIAAKKRGNFPWVTPIFTETADSGGAAWEYIPIVLTEAKDAYQPQLGTTIRDFLDECTGQDPTKQFAMRAEWVMWPGFKLDVRKVIGVHREGQVIFFEGGLLSKSRTRVRTDVKNVIIVRDVNGRESNAVDAESVQTWNRREVLENRDGNVTDAGRRNAVAQNYLDQQKNEQSEWVITVPYGETGRMPFVDYNLGDWIGVGNYDPLGGPSTVDAYRVLAITINVDDTGKTTVELTLQTKLQALLLKLQQELTNITSNLNEVADNNDSASSGSGSAGTGIGSIGDIDYSDLNGNGAYSGIQVFIQSSDPGDKANPGDFWYNTAYDPDTDFTDEYVEDNPTIKIGQDGLQYKPIST